MKVAIYGEANVRGSGAWCYKNAMVRCGATVVEFDCTYLLEQYLYNPIWKAWRALGFQAPRFPCRRHAEAFVSFCRVNKPDLVVILKGLFLSEEDIRSIRSAGTVVVNVNHDDFFSLNRNNRSRSQLRSLREYDGVFVTRQANVSELQGMCRHAEFFPFAYDPNIHRVVVDDASLGTGVDCLFVGTFERERASLMESLIRAAPVSLEIHGGSWGKLRKSSPLRPHVKSEGLWVDDMARAIGLSKITLGFLRKANRDEYTQRSFEIPACGGVMLAERTPSHLCFFAEGEEAEFFDPACPEELIGKVRELLESPKRRERLRNGGRAALARNGHTYDRRVERLITFSESVRSSQAYQR